jgi:hypothetical protein
MRRIVLICAALVASLAMTASASARIAIAPLSVQDGSLIEVKHGRGHSHGHKFHRGRGHHHGWHRGRGHHHGWYRGRGHHKHGHNRRHRH